MPEKILEVKIAELMTGDILAADVNKTNGGILVKKNTEITEHIIGGLRKNYNGSIYVFRNVKDDDAIVNINIIEIITRECEEIVDFTILKYIKKNKNINEIKEIITDVLKNDKIIELLLLLRSTGSDIFNHCISVAVYCIAVGKELHFPAHRLMILGTAAIIHDIGMIKIDKEILNKDDTLNDREKDIIKKHPKLGFDIINEKGYFNAEISNVILQHHERFDGTGYPNKILNEKIHIMAKIIGICDIFEALTSDRPYRKKFRRSESIEYLLGTGNYYFNHDIIQALINSIIVYPYGQWIILNTGEKGIVIEDEKNKLFSIRPRIMIYFDNKGDKLSIPKYVDLSRRENNNILIDRIL